MGSNRFDSELESDFQLDQPKHRTPPHAWLLGRESFRRVRVLRTLASILVFLMCVALMGFGVSNGWIDSLKGSWLSILMLSSCVFFYAAIRSGWSERFAEPAMTLAQVLTAQTWIGAAYSITNEAHGATLILYALVMFFGVFNMDARSAKISGVYVVCVAGISMLYKSQTDPVHYPGRIELVHFLFIVVTVPVMAYLATQIAAMRNKLKAQQRDLTAALERIREMAVRDELTGLINRRQLILVLQEYKALLKRNNLELWIALIDLDFFKRINDTWGHGVGDEVLIGFANHAVRTLRSADVVGRWGGEEFLFIM
ncbi:MAG TPA: diguanylate cyclase, partial [Aquabacterium sp.]|nr:diguanylate cyclase [Aquabacterium sp.]